MGITVKDLDAHSTRYGAVAGKKCMDIVAGTNLYALSFGPTEKNLRVVGFGGIMQAAGNPGDTIQLFRVRGGAGVAISDAIPLNALADTDWFAAAQINDASWNVVQQSGDFLAIITTGNPVCYAMVDVIPV